MSRPANKIGGKKRARVPGGSDSKAAGPLGGAAAASRLRAQTRKVLGKHYRAKYGVR